MSAKSFVIAITVTSGLLGSLVARVQAQNAPVGQSPLAESQTAKPGSSSLGETGLDEIIVTAQKRSERLQDVPIAITAIGQDVIQGLGAKTFDDVARTVPGLVMSANGFGNAQPVIRGVIGLAGVSTVGYYIDDTQIQVLPMGFISDTTPQLYDIDRVEVLRGPQGTLYGSGAMGGTIHLVTPQAPLETQSGRVSAEVSGASGINPNYDVGGALGAPLVEGVLGFRGSAYFHEAGGYIDRLSRTNGDVIDNNVNNTRSGQAHLSFLWRPTSALSVTPSVLYQFKNNDDLPIFSSALPVFEQNNVIKQPGHDNFVLPSLTVRYEFGAAALTAVTSFFHRQVEQQYDYSTFVPSIFSGKAIVPGFENYLADADQQYLQSNLSEEIRLVSSSVGRFNWIIGAYFSRQHQHMIFPLYEPEFPALVDSLFGSQIFGPLLPGNLDFDTFESETSQEYAGFGNLSYTITSKLKLTAGVRVSKTEFSFNQVANGPLNGGLSNDAGTQRSTPVTPKAALSYNFDPDQLGYLSAAKGFRVGGVNKSVPATTCAADLAEVTGSLSPRSTYNPDSVWSYELGYKALLANRHVSLDASLYRVNWSNIQSLVNLPDCGFTFTTNFGTARSQGAELELTVAPLQGLQITASATYTDSTLTSNTLGPVALSGPNQGEQAVYGQSGDRLPFIPKLTGALSVEYRFSMTGENNGYFRGDYQYVGSSTRTAPPGEAGYDPLTYSADSYSYGSLRVGALHGNWDVALFVNNIANARPIIAKNDTLSPHLQAVETTLQPRVFGLSAQRQF